MYELSCLNLITGKRFSLFFDSMYKLRKFVYKCNYSKKIKIISKPLNWNK